MRKIALLLILATSVSLLSAQNIGIGTTTPNAKAALEINSTTKGLLIPSMTSTQRSFITSPPNGLMVYDTDVNQLYHYDGSNWRKMLNSTYWNQSTTRSWVYNSTDSVGIGTSVPAQRLDVNGNIRSRDDVLADGNMVATGNISGASLSASGNLTTVGNSLLNGEVTTNSNLNLNNTTATIQLKSGNINKGFFQLSGDNVRMGTNSGNSTGNLIIRMSGNDRVTINSSGDIDLDGKITRTAVTGPSSLLPICFGFINSTGTILSGTSNFSVTRLSEGRYQITCANMQTLSVILVSAINTDRIIAAFQTGQTTFEVHLNSVSISGAPRDDYFYFVVYRPS